MTKLGMREKEVKEERLLAHGGWLSWTTIRSVIISTEWLARQY